MMNKRVSLGGLLLLSVGTASAGSIEGLSNLNQAQFVRLSEDLGAAMSYKALAPVEPLGISGFDVGVEFTATALQNADVLELASNGDGVSTLPVPKLHLHKGLPANFDIGFMYGTAPSTNLHLWGAELRYAIIEGGTLMPAVAVRGTYSAMQGVDDLDLTTTGIELGISKGFVMFTPYGGIGNVWVDSSPGSSTGLRDESLSMFKYFAGVNMNLGLTNLAIEADMTGDAVSYGAKLGWRF